MKISGHEDMNSLKSYDCTDIEDLRSIAQKYTPRFNITPIPPPKPTPPPINEVEEMKKLIQQLLEENQKLKEKKGQNSMYD
jgi:hypothetical protein